MALLFTKYFRNKMTTSMTTDELLNDNNRSFNRYQGSCFSRYRGEGLQERETGQQRERQKKGKIKLDAKEE